LVYAPIPSEEITEMYFGLDMEKSDVEDIVGRARLINSDIAIFRAKRDRGGKLVFDKF
jgi:hypothetical protein